MSSFLAPLKTAIDERLIEISSPGFEWLRRTPLLPDFAIEEVIIALQLAQTEATGKLETYILDPDYLRSSSFITESSNDSRSRSPVISSSEILNDFERIAIPITPRPRIEDCPIPIPPIPRSVISGQKTPIPPKAKIKSGPSRIPELASSSADPLPMIEIPDNPPLELYKLSKASAGLSEILLWLT